MVSGKYQAKQGSQTNTDYTEKQIKPQITRKESQVWRFAQGYMAILREAPYLASGVNP
jgi:hypothetical protein